MKLPAWRTAQLERKGPRTNHRANAASVLAKLQEGAVLYSGRVRDGRWWMVSDGTRITRNTAKAVISDPRVVGCGDSLFEGVLAQTFRYIKPEGETHG
jgi:hypothetical protein